MINDIDIAADIVAEHACHHVRITQKLFEGMPGQAYRFAKDRAVGIIIDTLDGSIIDRDLEMAAECFDRSPGPVAQSALRRALMSRLAVTDADIA